MELNINDLTTSERELEVTFPYDEIKKDIETEVLKQSRKIQIPGFRKGKVPISMLKKMYGDALEYDASETVANNQFWKIAKEKELKPIGQPQLKDLKFNPGTNLYFKVKYEIFPEIDVKDYTGNDIEVPDLSVRDEDVNHEIEHILKSNKTTEPAEVINGENYNIKVEFQRLNEAGETFEGTKPEVLNIDLTNPQVQKEIKENSQGKKVGEIFNFSFKDEKPAKPEEEKEKKVGETYNYQGKILEINKTVLPELNEELIKKVSKDKASNEQELKDQIKKDIQAYYDQKTDEFIKDRIIKAIVKNNEFTPPHSLVHNILHEYIKQEEEEAKKYGMKNIDHQEAHKRLEPAAELEVKWYVLKSAIQKKESITVNDEDLNELAKIDAEKTGLPVEKLINYYKSSNYGEKLIDKTLLDFLKEKNNIKKVDPETLSKKGIEEINEK